VENGIFMKGKTVIPHSSQRKYISIDHRLHPGCYQAQSKMIFCPTMSDITEELLSCSVCNSTKPYQQKE